MIETYCSGGINWNWYLQGEFDDINKTVHVFFYDRWHKYDTPKHPRAMPSFLDLMETKERELYGIKVNGIEYLVTNPAYVFSYSDMSHLEME